MVVTELDPRLTFDTFVVGPANRLASAAARRAADSPGTSYNPLFIYSASGLGKSHILSAIAHHASRVHPDFKVLYQTLERYLDELTVALEAGDREVLRERYQELDILLLDDVQFLTGQSEAQEMLLRTLDSLNMSESQIVLASDRPPSEIDGLDARLVSRFSGGLIVDIGSPEYETRVAIIRRKAEERGAELSQGVAETIARVPFKNVRELGGALNRVFAVQELEERSLAPEEIAQILGLDDRKKKEKEQGERDDLRSFVDELSGEVAATVEDREAPWRKLLRGAAEEAEREGLAASRIRRFLEGDGPPEDVEAVAVEFRERMNRLKQVRIELDQVGNPWPEAAFGILKDPERLDEAESLLASARERVRPFPPLQEGPSLEDLDGFPGLALKAGTQIATGETPEYTPLYLWSEDGSAPRALMGAVGRSFRAARPEAVVAITSAGEFAEDFIRALSSGVAGAWRERWWSADLLLVHGVQELSETERAQDEFFHLFEALKRRKARICVAADRPPSGVEGIDDRLRSRFEGGLVLDVEVKQLPQGADDLTPGEVEEPPRVVIPPLDQIVKEGDRGLFSRDLKEQLDEAEWVLGFEREGTASGPPAAAGRQEPQEPAAAPDAPGDEGGGADVTAARKSGKKAEEKGEAAEPTPPPEPEAAEEAGAAADATGAAGSERAATETAAGEAWKPSREKVILEWPVIGDRVLEELD